ncbi:hypothetical protein V6N13_083369 [Hibiscus sabdariffa]|uniref:Large ribosomal subunit protein uL18 C-terminal eukaryotes domain-containing protein n=1 Tax=Hibiscus sabdariffa TaxID=183260 RepID=A0ABR2SXU4_9ROSI
MNKGGVYVKHAVIRPIIAGIFSRKRRYGVYLTPRLGSKSLASLLLSLTPTPSLTPTTAIGCLSQHQSSVVDYPHCRSSSSVVNYRRRPPFEATAAPKSKTHRSNRPQPRERVRNLRTRGMDLETPQSKMVFKFGVQIKTLMEDEPENYQSHFSEYIKRGIEADSLEGMYKKVHAAIRADPTTKKSGKPGKCVHIEFYNSTYVH